jgi:hypothetical protein
LTFAVVSIADELVTVLAVCEYAAAAAADVVAVVAVAVVGGDDDDDVDHVAVVVADDADAVVVVVAAAVVVAGIKPVWKILVICWMSRAWLVASCRYSPGQKVEQLLK